VFSLIPNHLHINQISKHNVTSHGYIEKFTDDTAEIKSCPIIVSTLQVTTRCNRASIDFLIINPNLWDRVAQVL